MSIDFGAAIHAIDQLSTEEAANQLIEKAGDDWDRHVTLGKTLMFVEHGWCPWTMGKLISRVERNWGETSITSFAQDVGISQSRAYGYRKTYLAFPTEESRKADLTFSHHEIAARTPEPEKAIEIPYTSEEEKNRPMTVREFQAEMTKSTPRPTPPLWEDVYNALKDKRKVRAFLQGFVALLLEKGYTIEEIDIFTNVEKKEKRSEE